MKYFLLILIFISYICSSYSQTYPPGEKSHFVIESVICENTSYETPYYILRSDSEYPKILFDAAIHGDEVAGVYAIDTVMKYINLKSGTIGFVPKVNINAFNTNVREVNIDLNHVFPGNPQGSIYEEKLAYDFMEFVKEFSPDYVINLHEAWTKFDKNLYEKQKDKSFGQTIITNAEEHSDYLIRSHLRINSFVTNPEYSFRIQYFPYKPNHSMDNVKEKLNIPSYTIETLRILPMEQRIEYQVICILAFIEEAGLIFDFER